MPTARFIHDGSSIDHTPSADVSAGDVVVQGDLIGIAKLDIPAGTLGALAVRGVFDLPKSAATGNAIAVGLPVYWDEDSSVATPSDGSGSNKLLGKAVAAAGDQDATVRVRLDQ